MKSLRNRVTLIGRLGKDPEVKVIDGKKKMARFSLATSDQYINKDGSKVESTQWHNIVVWGGLSETCEKYLNKGMEIAIEGKIVYRNWEDKEGKTHYMTEINVMDLLMIGGKGN